MARRNLKDRNIRKLTKSGGKSIAVTLPIEIVRALRWRSRQRVIIRKRGKEVIIKDYDPRK